MKSILMYLLLFAITATSLAQETSHLAFVSEYVRELGLLENLRAAGELESKEKGSNQFSNMIRYSTRLQLELRTNIAMLKGMHFGPQNDDLIKNIIDLHTFKIELHQAMIDIASEFIGGPKPNVDYGKLAAEMPKITASLEYLDKSFLITSVLVFGTLIDMKPDSKGHASHLIITRAERQQLIRDLKKSFGSKLEAKNQNYIVSAASVLLTYLQKDFKSSDDPW